MQGVPNPDKYDDEDIEDFRNVITLQRDKYIDLKMILVMLLALSGITINWMVAYRNRKLAPIDDSTPGAISVDCLENIDTVEPDEF